MSELIEKQAVIDALLAKMDTIDDKPDVGLGLAVAAGMKKALPSVTPAEKVGHWVMPQQDDGMSDPIYYQVRCSACKWDVDPQTWYEEMAHDYCPNCGAKMQEVEG